MARRAIYLAFRASFFPLSQKPPAHSGASQSGALSAEPDVQVCNKRTIHCSKSKVKTWGEFVIRMNTQYDTEHFQLFYLHFPSFSDDGSSSPRACRIHGHLYVNKVAGNFHITIGKYVSASLVPYFELYLLQYAFSSSHTTKLIDSVLNCTRMKTHQVTQSCFRHKLIFFFVKDRSEFHVQLAAFEPAVKQITLHDLLTRHYFATHKLIKHVYDHLSIFGGSGQFVHSPCCAQPLPLAPNLFPCLTSFLLLAQCFD